MGVYIKGATKNEVMKVLIHSTYWLSDDVEIMEIETPHGRFVDIDAVYNDICDSIDAMTRIGLTVDGEYLWGKLNDAIDNTPTVIEAEGE